MHDIVNNFNTDQYKEYVIERNYMLDSNVHTALEITEMLEDMADNIEDIEYIPAKLTSLGLPWIEAGDYVDVDTKDDGVIRMLVESHTLSGIQKLTDDIECEDDPVNVPAQSYVYNSFSETLIIGG